MLLLASSVAVLAFLTTAYLIGVLYLVRRSVWWEAAFVWGLPILMLPFLDPQRLATDRLLILESILLSLVVLTRFLTEAGASPTLRLGLRRVFGIWFLLQSGGFLRAQISQGMYLSALLSALMGVGVAIFFFGLTRRLPSAVKDGEVLIFGSPPPTALRLLYVFWLLNVLFVEYNTYLPKVLVPTIHLVSVAIAFRSPDFFRVRILTASHLFLLNQKLSYVYDVNYLGADFAVLPPLLASDSLSDVIHVLALTGAILTFAWWLFQLKTESSAPSPSN